MACEPFHAWTMCSRTVGKMNMSRFWLFSQQIAANDKRCIFSNRLKKTCIKPPRHPMTSWPRHDLSPALLRTTPTSSGSSPAPSCGWATSTRAARCRRPSTSCPAPSPSSTCWCGCTTSWGGGACPARTPTSVRTYGSSRSVKASRCPSSIFKCFVQMCCEEWQSPRHEYDISLTAFQNKLPSSKESCIYKKRLSFIK